MQNLENLSTPILMANIILPLAVYAEYTYLVPPNLADKVKEGIRVEVQFGAKRVYAGVVKRIFEGEAPTNIRLKPIANILDEHAIVPTKQLQLWQWIAQYYMCSEGEVMQAALPSAFKLSSETKLLINPAFNQDFSLLDDREYLIAEALTLQTEISIEDVQAILETKNVVHVVKSMLEKGVILLQEALVERYKPQTVAYLSLNPIYHQPEQLQDLLTRLQKEKRNDKQLMALMAFIHLSKTKGVDEVRKKELLEKAEITDSSLKTLIKKGVFTEFQKSISRLDKETSVHIPLDYDLSPNQETALTQIKQQFEQKQVVLLHGITSSGKTQLYIKLIQEAIANNQQVLYLLPEIALTAQMIARLRKVFGDEIGIYHSKFNDQERVEIWHKVLNNEYKVVIGARSAVFLPLKNLALVVIDEEHDPSFKQFEPAPHYHARDTAIYLASLYGAKTLLGSATPALETYFNATKTQKYGLVTLNERYGGVLPPIIEVVSITKATKNGQMHSHFTDQLLTEMKTALDHNEQVIVFQNRRGYSPSLLCADCGWIPQCVQCDVSLTYHKASNDLKCHYCDHKRPLIARCEACGSTNLQIQGFGTEKIQDELQDFLKDTPIGRLDLDSARTKHGFEQIINDFEDQKTKVLVGTQMVTKGLDFENVSLVAVLSADQLLGFPDFRATERGFQLMMQVSGRAGRRNKQGKVLIQSRNTNYKTLTHVLEGSYEAFFNDELHERFTYLYPPFVRLVVLTLKHKDNIAVNKAAAWLQKALQVRFNKHVLGPAVPMVSRIRSYYLRQFIIKIDRQSTQLQQHKQFIADTIHQLQQQPSYKSLVVQIDVDPY